MDDQEIRNRIVRKMLRNNVLGGHKKQVQTVIGWAVPSHEAGRAEDLLDELVAEGVVERYGGGHRENVRLSSVQVAVDYLEENGGDVPFGFR